MWIHYVITACVLISSLASADLCELRSELYSRAKLTGSDVALICRKDDPIFEYRKAQAPERMDLKEMGGAIYALAVLSLVDDQAIPCVEVPLHRIFPDIFEKSPVTLKHLISHTSGLTRECEEKWVLKAIERLAEKPVDEYLGEKLFLPLGIQDFSLVYSGGSHHLYLSAGSLCKIGSMISSMGNWQGRQILSQNSIRTLMRPSSSSDPFFGFGWYLELYDVGMAWKEPLLQSYAEMNFPTPYLKMLVALQGREVHFGGLIVDGKIIRLWGPELFTTFGGNYTVEGQNRLKCFFSAIAKRHLSMGSFNIGAIKSIVARDKNGLQLIVMPREEIVAVRLAPSVAPDFDDFLDLVDSFAKEYECLP